MAWQTEMVRMIRHMVGDLSDTPTFSDNRLQELIIVAAQLVSLEADFQQAYTLDVDQSLLTPDPSDPANRDENFINLVSMKSACILDLSDARIASGQAISIRDGSSAIALGEAAKYKIAYLGVGWCKLFATALEEYKTNTKMIAGAAIMSPFKIYSQGGYDSQFPGAGHWSTGYRY